ncbi:MAG: PBP1A family penicillin-binding protein [Actinobacteria bacterium]|nr:MAG: PBP1A family penicillin-binding protein [Actinomycetota bacterium]
MSRTKRQKRIKKRSSLKRRVLLIIAFCIIATSIFALVTLGQALHDLPDLNNKNLGKMAQTSKIYDDQGKIITPLHAEQNRIVIPLTKIPKVVQKAVIAIEDERFYSHRGVDFLAIARALYEDIRNRKIVEGGSTITQQYVKQTYISPQRTINRKIKEAFLAYEIEKRYSKRKILEMYLNTVYFGNGNYGIETAAESFFGKKADKLNLSEAATLAGLIRSPGYYSPYIDSKRTQQRRNLVIDKMYYQKMISRLQARLAKKAPIKAHPQKYSSTYAAPYFVEYVKSLIMKDKKFGTTEQERANVLYKGGLKIYTTINLTMQANAETAAKILNYPTDPAVSLVAINPESGHVKAMVGGKDFFDPKNKQAKFNLATQGRRQAGSSFKVFVLATALDKDYSPYKTYNSSPGTLYWQGTPWRVDNYTEGRGYGSMSLSEATVRSVNAVFARLILDVGPENVAEMAHKLGIVSPVDPLPAIALGGLKYGVNTLEMANAMATLANNGNYNKAIAITKILDTNDNVILENKPSNKPVLDADVAAAITSILQNVIWRGTGRAANLGRPAAGKTGTAENYQDAWFVGYTPDLAAAVWVGYPDRQVSMIDVHGRSVTGGSFPAQIWQNFMHETLKGRPYVNFQSSPYQKTKQYRICTATWKLATQYCPSNLVKEKYYKRGAAPTEYCTLHQAGTQIPNIVGMDQSDAMQELNNAGFVVEKKYSSSSEQSAGTIIGQSPAAGTQTDNGSTVTVWISTGPADNQSQTVPDITGLSESAAIQNLQSNGYNSYRVYEKAASKYKGVVIRQEPEQGSNAAKGSTVTVWIGS